ncbi:MAG TPA: polyprenyl synthetase family protein [Longimicrobiales bacterium]|nr:polyprenyl synthetase family protein [Longimicrobiales bacterium]
MLRTAPPKLAQIQRPVRDRLEAVVEELRRIVVADFTPIEEVNEYLLRLRGKLFRPMLVLLSNEIGDRPRPEAVTLAAVVELVHLATLVHDDAVDHSVLRRGMPTVNALWNHQTAVIMGDYLYSRSVTELAALGRIELIRVLSRAANEMSVGEMRQLMASDVLRFTETEYYRLIACKTASLMSAACEMGALVGDETYREPLARFGHYLGMAFQIADDLLDYTETEAVTGKPSGHDLREHKVTLPLIAAYGVMEPPERREIEAFFADPEPTDEGIERVVQLVREHGGLKYARDRAEEYGALAAESLATLPPCEATDALRDAITYVIDRRR